MRYFEKSLVSLNCLPLETAINIDEKTRGTIEQLRTKIHLFHTTIFNLIKSINIEAPRQ